MDRDLLDRRQTAADRHDRALETWPDRQGGGFAAELSAVVEVMRAVAEEAERRGGQDPEELGRSWRWLGDALFDHGRGVERGDLEEAARCYQRAGAHLKAAVAPAEEGKLGFSYGNTLLGLSGGLSVALLDLARERYERALALFEVSAPELTPRARSSLEMVKAQLAMARKRQALGDGIDELAGLAKRLESDPGSFDEVRRELDAVQARGPKAEELAGAARGALGALRAAQAGAPRGAAPRPEELVALEGQISAMAELGKRPDGRDRAARDEIFGLLRERLAQEAAGGRVSAARRDHLEELIDRFERVQGKGSSDVGEMAEDAAAMRGIAAEVAELVDTASLPGRPPPEGSKAAALQRSLRAMRRALLADLNRHMCPKGESEAGQELAVRMAYLDGAVQEGQDDPAAIESAAARARRLALEVRRFAHRHHPMLVRPLWPRRAVVQDSSLVAFAGSHRVGEAVAEACRRVGLELAPPTGGGVYAEERWDLLRRSALAVFDLTLPKGPARAAVGYEVGIATAIGLAHVVVLEEGQPPPFDVEIAPILFRGDDGDVERLAAALTSALFSPARGFEAGSIEATARQVEALLDGRATGQLGIALRALLEAREDAVAFTGRLKILLGMLGDDAPELVFPSWPAAYPDPARPRCFHVMPFSPEGWAARVTAIAKEACGPFAEHVRGDEPSDPKVVASIWDQVATATHVLVDLTGANENVAFELGWAHVMGRHCLLVSETGAGAVEKGLFEAVRRLQVRRYSLERGGEELARLVEGFVRPGGGPAPTPPPSRDRRGEALPPRDRRVEAPPPAPPPAAAPWTAGVRQQIEAAIDDERRLGRFATLARRVAAVRGASPTDAQIGEAVGFVEGYVRHVPFYMEQGFEAATRAGIGGEMRAALEVALQYWQEPNDVIPDHLGLLGILDDAYVSLCLVQALSTDLSRRTGSPLLAQDLTPANQGVRVLIGEPAASLLDQIIANSLGRPGYAGALEQLLAHAAAFGGSPMVVNDPIWGTASVDDIVNARLGAMGVV